MYLTEINLQNAGPITNCRVKLPFENDGRPLPVIVVGANGSGKSVFLSYVVDALTEFGKEAFRDIVPEDGLQRPYFRIVGQSTIRTGQSFGIGLLSFKAGESTLSYCEKSGDLDPATYSPELKATFAAVWNWPLNGSYKTISADKSIVEGEMRKGAYAFFPASRRELPDWLNPNSLKVSLGISPLGQFIDRLEKPLWVESCATENAHWILDVFLDSHIDIVTLMKAQSGASNGQVVPAQLSREMIDIRDRRTLRQARENVESILKAILQDEQAELVLNFRQGAISRLAIQLGDGRVIPSLQSLSSGQSVLFQLFTTIIRYADRGDINMSIRLGDITGIVVIDEIDAHLHASLQHDVVPRLLKLFPKVQFILSSHAPLFPLGMEKLFGREGFTILEMPTGNKIVSERFAEFGASFERYQETKLFEEVIEQRLTERSKPLVLTEGPLDPKYISTALQVLGETELLQLIEIKFVGIEDAKGCRHGGDTGLNHFRNVCEANPSLLHRPTLVLYDCDTNKPPEQIGRLWIRSIPKNNGDFKAKRGIENLLPAAIFETRFYTERIKEGEYGEKTTVSEFDKTAFCKFVCEERRNAKDFANFGIVVTILKEFVAANTAPAIAQ